MSLTTAGLTEDECRILGIVRDQVPVTPVTVSKPVSQSFVEPAWYKALTYAMMSPTERGCTLFGPRGSGKSTAIRELAKAENKQCVTLQCAANMQIDDLLGTVGLTNGTTNFTDGPLTIAVRNGCWLLAEEANVLHPGVWSVVNTLTDKTGEKLRLKTGEVIDNHPEFRLVLLFNEGYDGTRTVNAALRDRLMPVYTAYPSAAIEMKMLSQMRPQLSPAHLQKMVTVANMIRNANLNFDLSIRSLDRWAGLYLSGVGSWLQCYKIAIIDLIGDPKFCGPQIAVLSEIANQGSVASW